ncbi:MAG: aminoglycoside phosphotransferase family protein [Thermodesulfobacteriota bacterium]
MDSSQLQKAHEAARQFISGENGLQIDEIGAGNINDTFLVSSNDQPAFILQRLSPQAFNAPELICENLATLNNSLPAEHLHRFVPHRRWAIPQLLTTLAGNQWWCDNHGTWRALSYIGNTTTLSSLTSQHQAREVGRALAIFHNLAREIPAAGLHITIPHFHETPHYFRLYEAALSTNPSCPKNALAAECQNFIEEHRGFVAILEEARLRGELQTTTIHGDPKLANILFDQETSRACALIDLDTVGPGLLLYDIGDCLRSCCNPGGCAYDLDTTCFDRDICLEILHGFLEDGRHLLNASDKKYLLAAIRLIPLELGLRFFTDYLQGCHYFKTASPEETLQRAAAQFRLTASIERQQDLLEEKLQTLFSDH